MLFVQIHRRILALSLTLACLLPAPAILAQTSADELPVYDYRVIKTYPHNPQFFTQGLLFHNGVLYEGTGRNGQSALMQLDLETGKVLSSRPLASRYFGEGIAVANGQIFQLTWRENMVFVYEPDTLAPITSHYWPREGWGLTWNGEHLILSDGSDQLFFINPETFVPEKQIDVRLNNQPVFQLNELEFIDGEIWANVWMSQQIVRIDPDSGQVSGIIDLTGLAEQTQTGGRDAVLNGIAWNEETRQLIVTGKLWAHMFEIELVPR
ncbi:MAG: glutaminyl-peptide cyclotransferase [Pseudohongiella sp.]|nr:glutaminyl-peptide cyclotransferase [Pseudohongiella sp.]